MLWCAESRAKTARQPADRGYTAGGACASLSARYSHACLSRSFITSRTSYAYHSHNILLFIISANVAVPQEGLSRIAESPISTSVVNNDNNIVMPYIPSHTALWFTLNKQYHYRGTRDLCPSSVDIFKSVAVSISGSHETMRVLQDPRRKEQTSFGRII